VCRATAATYIHQLLHVFFLGAIQELGIITAWLHQLEVQAVVQLPVEIAEQVGRMDMRDNLNHWSRAAEGPSR
jgi:hypothetical protein